MGAHCGVTVECRRLRRSRIFWDLFSGSTSKPDNLFRIVIFWGMSTERTSAACTLKIFITSICGRHVYIYYTCAPAFDVWGLYKHGSEVEPWIIRYLVKYVFDLITRQTPQSQRIDYKVVVPTDFITLYIALRTVHAGFCHVLALKYIGFENLDRIYMRIQSAFCTKNSSLSNAVFRTRFFLRARKCRNVHHHTFDLFYLHISADCRFYMYM